MGIVQALAAVEVGGYASWWKAALLLLPLLAWARLLTWIDKDADATYLPRVPLNVGFLSTAAVFLAALLLLPNVWIALAVIFLGILITLGVYLYMRQQKVGLGDLRKQFDDWVHGLGKKTEKKADVHNEVQFLNKLGAAMATPGGEDPARPAFDALQSSLADPLIKGADRFDLSPTDQATGVRFSIDGVTYRGTPLDRNVAAQAITLVKQFAQMDVADRRKPQTGALRVAVNGKRHDLQITTMGTTAGESMQILVNPKTKHNVKIEESGMVPDQLQKVQDSIADGTGIVLVAAPKEMGMTSLLYALLRGHDAFLQHIITLERNATTDLDGITQNKLPRVPPPGEETRQVQWLCSQEPDVVMVDQVDEQAAARTLIDYARGGRRRVYVGVRAGSTFEAIAAWQKVVGDPAVAVSDLNMALASRVLRKLCGACKVGYVPDQAQLTKLNMNAATVTKLFRARTEPMRNDRGQVVPCDFCQELYYRGRMGVYEIFTVDDEVRRVLAGGATPNTIRGSFRKQKAKLLQEAALQQVELGNTSVQEVLRVLKPATDQPVVVRQSSGGSQSGLAGPGGSAGGSAGGSGGLGGSRGPGGSGSLPAGQ